MRLRSELLGLGTRPYPLDSERRRRVLIALAERDMNISALARALNLPQSLLSMTINGRRLSLKTEKRIADFLDKPADYLFPPRTAEELGKMRLAEAEAKGTAA